MEPAFDRICLGELRAVLNQGRWELVPFLFGRKPQVDMCAGKVVGVELKRIGFMSASIPSFITVVSRTMKTYPTNTDKLKQQKRLASACDTIHPLPSRI